MQALKQAFDDVKDLYEKVVGNPAPEIKSESFVSFPPGVNPIDHVTMEVKQLKELSDQVALAPKVGTWVPPADSFASKEAFHVSVEVPGLEKEDLKVFVAGNECVVRGERKMRETPDELQPVAIERQWGAFERRFPVPPACRLEDLTARYHQGVLELRIPFVGDGVPLEAKVDMN